MRTPSISAWVVLTLACCASSARGQSCSTTRISEAFGPPLLVEAAPVESCTPDGRFVAFDSRAANLVPGDTNGIHDVFVLDRQTGSIERVSVDSNGQESHAMHPDRGSLYPRISADARYVAFASGAYDLAPDSSHLVQVYVHDRTSGQTVLVSKDSTGQPGNSDSGWYFTEVGIGGQWYQAPIGLSVSGDGCCVAFGSFASNLVAGDLNGQQDVFVHDVLTKQTICASRTPSGSPGSGFSMMAAFSQDGHFVAFTSLAGDLVPGDANGKRDIFVYDVLGGGIEIVSLTSSGAPADGNSDFAPALSADGRYVAFVSYATNLVPGDTNFQEDIFLRDRLAATTERVSVASSGAQASSFSRTPTMSADGRLVAFTSPAPTLVPGDAGNQYDVFVHDRQTRETRLVSAALDGLPANSASAEPWISGDGRAVVFHSFASDLVDGDTNGEADIFVRDCSLPEWTFFCAGTAAACPCSNAGGADAGCENSSSGGGGSLTASGTPSVTADDVALFVEGLPSPSVALFVQGTAQAGSGSGVPFGDGLLCIGGSIVRLGTKPVIGGSAAFGAGIGSDPLISIQGAIPPTGGIRHYQVYYRDSANFCTSGAFNLSNGVTLVWTP